MKRTLSIAAVTLIAAFVTGVLFLLPPTVPPEVIERSVIHEQTLLEKAWQLATASAFGHDVDYRLSEDAHVLVFLDGRRIIRGRSSQPKNKVSWNGSAGGRLLPQGKYTLVVSALERSMMSDVKKRGLGRGWGRGSGVVVINLWYWMVFWTRCAAGAPTGSSC